MIGVISLLYYVHVYMFTLSSGMRESEIWKAKNLWILSMFEDR